VDDLQILSTEKLPATWSVKWPRSVKCKTGVTGCPWEKRNVPNPRNVPYKTRVRGEGRVC